VEDDAGGSKLARVAQLGLGEALPRPLSRRRLPVAEVEVARVLAPLV